MKSLNELRDILPFWLRKEVIVSDRGKYRTLDFPFLDVNSDYMRLYVVEKDDDSVYLTDDGESYAAFWERLNGLQDRSLSSFLEESLKRTVTSLPGIDFNNETKEICRLLGKSDDIGFTISMLIEAMIRCSSLCTLTSFQQAPKKNTTKLRAAFEQKYLIKNRCSYEPDPEIPGVELSTHTFDFLVTGRQDNLVRILNDRESQTKKALLYDWKDVVDYEKRPPLVAVSKSGEPKNPKNRNENDRLTRIIKANNIMLFSEHDDAQKLDNYFSSLKAV